MALPRTTHSDITGLNVSPMVDLVETFREKVGSPEGARRFKNQFYNLGEIGPSIRDAVDVLSREPPAKNPYGHVVLRSAGTSAIRLFHNAGRWDRHVWEWEPQAIPNPDDLRSLKPLEVYTRYLTERVLAHGLIYCYQGVRDPPGDTNISAQFPPEAKMALEALQDALERLHHGQPLRYRNVRQRPARRGLAQRR